MRECYRRAAQADRSGGMLALGVLYARSGTVLGMQIDPSEAARWFRAAIDARYFDPQDLISARVELAKLTSAHPGQPGVPSKEEALELLSYVLQVETNLGSYRYQEALRLRGLFQEAPPARD
ncbi:MAG: hypothetical protein KDD82_25735 [Planctomycetes bacterium]|nr:hypothetical protein [Planctomycetota bacterium]